MKRVDEVSGALNKQPLRSSICFRSGDMLGLSWASSQKWRPELTPYRSFVLFLTIGLGSSKAFATAQGLSLVATNIEWITGVLIFSVLSSTFKLLFDSF